MYPFLLIVAPVTLSPRFFSTGIDSPVNIDSSIEVDPKVITPSKGIFCPGLTTAISPTFISSIGVFTSIPSINNIASLAPNSNNFFNAPCVLLTLIFSKDFPKKTKATITPALS